WLASYRQVGQHWYLRRVPIMKIMRRELIVPPQRACVGIECDQRTGVEVVTFSVVSPVVRVRIAGTEVHEVRGRIVAARGPHGPAAARHHVGAGPRVTAALARCRDGVKPP